MNDINWDKAYSLARQTTIDNYSRIFHFKITHNILYLNKALHRMQIADTCLCCFCQNEDETIVHLYAECPVVINIWWQLQSFFSRRLILPVITPQSAFLVFLEESENKILINQILLCFKIAIFKARESGYCNLLRIVKKIKQVKVIEKIISAKDERKKVYNDHKWSVINDLLV
jgi:hypothetical protein